MSPPNNTFLSRVFGANSYYPADEEALGGTELSLFEGVTPRLAQPPLYMESEGSDSDSDSDGLLDPPAASSLTKHGRVDRVSSPDPLKTPLPSIPFSSKTVPVTTPHPHPTEGDTHLLLQRRSLLPTARPGPRPPLSRLAPRERALWMWANVENLDAFLQDVYLYYLGKGLLCIMLAQAMDLLTLVFVVGFSIYVTSCLDLSQIPDARSLGDIRLPQCLAHMHPLQRLFGFIMVGYMGVRVVQLYYDHRRLVEVRAFYTHLLDISDAELGTVSWPQVVSRLSAVADANGMASRQEVKALDVVNRIMRKENYMIGMFNKRILDVLLPGPVAAGLGAAGSHPFLTKTLEWNLNLCVLNFIFTDGGQVHPKFLAERNRAALAEDLRRRFVVAGLLNLALAPFIVTYFVLLYFFRYFNEYKTNPGSVASARVYTPIAEWELREFNELYHIFRRRLNLSCAVADEYVLQFPSVRTHIVLKFVAFVAGAIVAVLVLLTMAHPDALLTLELTPGKNVLFYLSVVGSVWAVARNSLPKGTLVFDPERAVRRLCLLIHYMPPEWEGRLHTVEVRNDFTARFYELEVVLLVKELASLVLTPFILWYRLAGCSTRIVDFVREFTIHVDGLGYVCYFAMFDTDKHKRPPPPRSVPPTGNGRPGVGKLAAPTLDDDLREDYLTVTNDKMAKSYMHFVDSYGPTEEGRSKSARGPRVHIPVLEMEDSLLEGSYQLNLNPPAELEPHEGNSGVLKMLRQFYKPADIGR